MKTVERFVRIKAWDKRVDQYKITVSRILSEVHAGILCTSLSGMPSSLSDEDLFRVFPKGKRFVVKRKVLVSDRLCLLDGYKGYKGNNSNRYLGINEKVSICSP